jgi:hypothetical protein
MSVQQRYCFVAMPFRPELNFFFLYLKQYLEKEYGLRVERGDAKILTKPLMEKIREQILRADLVIGEVTDGNPNVFYELGLAHANHKPVLFLTRGSPDEAPVRSFCSPRTTCWTGETWCPDGGCRCASCSAERLQLGGGEMEAGCDERPAFVFC